MPDTQGSTPAPAPSDEVQALLSVVFREEAGKVVGALLRLHLARANARFDAGGKLVLLSEQDRSRWDHQMIHEASTLIEQAAALAEVEALGRDLEGYHLFHAIRAEFLLELGRSAQARAAELRALTLTDNQAEQCLLQQRLSTPGLAEGHSPE